MAPDTQDRITTFSSLRIRNYRWLFVGNSLSNGAQWVQQVTMGWLVYDLTGSGVALGSINMMRAVFSLLVAPLAGAAVDRYSRRDLMVWVKYFLVAISLGLGVLLIAGRAEIWHLFLFAGLGGAGMAIEMPLRQDAVMDLVPRTMAANALALDRTSWAVMRSVGPGIGGFTLLWIGADGNFLIQAAAHALLILAVYQINFPARATAARAQGGLREVLAGFQFVIHSPSTRTFVLLQWLLTIFIVPSFSALPAIYAKEVFHGGPEVLGYLLAAIGVGGIFGGLLTASLGRFDRRGLLQIVAFLVLCASMIGFALSSTLWVALPLLALAGFVELIYLSTNMTLLQLSIPDELRGRATSVQTLGILLSPVGALFAGIVADIWNVQAATIVMSGTAAVIMLAVAVFASSVRNYRMSEATNA